MKTTQGFNPNKEQLSEKLTVIPQQNSAKKLSRFVRSR